MRNFPMYVSHEVAAKTGCFNCLIDLTGQQYTDAGYPEGRGKYAVKCPECGFTKFYDVGELCMQSVLGRGE